MQFEEINQDLFVMNEATAFVHCISADFSLGARISLKVKNSEIDYSDIPTESAKADMLIDEAEIEKFIGGVSVWNG